MDPIKPTPTTSLKDPKDHASPSFLKKLWNQVASLFKGRKRGKQLFDIFVFSVGVLIIYKFGQLLAQEIEKMYPTEDSIKTVL